VYDATPVELAACRCRTRTETWSSKGALDGDAAYFAGYANQGRFGVANVW
jgi:hypothetical protein